MFPHPPAAALAGGEQQRAERGIGAVVMLAGAMIYRVASASGGSALKPTKLGDKAFIVEQFDAARVQQRQAVAIDFALGLFADFVFDVVLAESFDNPFTGVSVADNFVEIVCSKQ